MGAVPFITTASETHMHIFIQTKTRVMSQLALTLSQRRLCTHLQTRTTQLEERLQKSVNGVILTGKKLKTFLKRGECKLTTTV